MGEEGELVEEKHFEMQTGDYSKKVIALLLKKEEGSFNDGPSSFFYLKPHAITFLWPTHTNRLFTYSGLVKEALPAGFPPVT